MIQEQKSLNPAAWKRKRSYGKRWGNGKRSAAQTSEQQDLNQGMATGTHSSAHGGINWGPSYRLRSKIEQALPTKEQIEARAYELYLQRGGKDGHDLEDWLIAEKELKQEHTKAN